MAQENSFDIVAEVDLNEFSNAHQFALKQIGTRYDFKNKTAKLDFSKGEKKVVVEASDDYTADAIMDIFTTQLAKRGVDLKALESATNDQAPSGDVRRTFAIRDTMKSEECKKITKAIKDSKIKVKATVLGTEVRVSGKSRDDLQKIQTLVKDLGLECPLRFTNYK